MTHRSKYSQDAPEKAIEDRAIHAPVKHGVFDKKDELFAAPTAPSSTYVQEYYNATGERIKFVGTMIPLYITPEVLDAEFAQFIAGGADVAFIPKVKDANGKYEDDAATNYGAANTNIAMNFIVRGGPITMEDKIHAMSGTKVGRQILSQYVEPSDIFLKDGSVKPVMVKHYYVIPDGITGQAAGIDRTVRSTAVYGGMSGVLATLKGLIGNA